MRNSSVQGAIRQGLRRKELFLEGDFQGAFGIKPHRTPENHRNPEKPMEEFFLPSPSEITSEGARIWRF